MYNREIQPIQQKVGLTLQNKWFSQFVVELHIIAGSAILTQHGIHLCY